MNMSLITKQGTFRDKCKGSWLILSTNAFSWILATYIFQRCDVMIDCLHYRNVMVCQTVKMDQMRETVDRTSVPGMEV